MGSGFESPLQQATARHNQALTLSREICSPWDEAHALAGLGRCALAAGAIDDGSAQLHEALVIFQPIGAAEAAEVATELEALRQTPPDQPNDDLDSP